MRLYSYNDKGSGLLQRCKIGVESDNYSELENVNYGMRLRDDLHFNFYELHLLREKLHFNIKLQNCFESVLYS